MRRTHEVHACGVHVYEWHTHEMHVCEVHAYEVHAHEVHAYEGYADVPLDARRSLGARRTYT
jgi:hypothetical protein